MSYLKAVTKTQVEKKRYVVDYGCWLEDSETLFDHAIQISPLTDPPLVASDGVALDGTTQVAFFLSGGLAATLYLVRLIATTSIGQIKEDDLQMSVTS